MEEPSCWRCVAQPEFFDSGNGEKTFYDNGAGFPPIDMAGPGGCDERPNIRVNTALDTL